MLPSACILFMFVVSQSSQDDCSQKGTCSDCIQTDDCVWCFETISELSLRHVVVDEITKYRCASLQSVNDDWCQLEYIVSLNSSMEMIRNEELRGREQGDTSSYVQIKPQEIKLKMKIGVPYTFEIEFRQAKNYPVDLYFLMDLSKSMEKHKKKVSELGYKLVQIMDNITTNFQVGFGSFVDKVVAPFTETLDRRPVEPCRGCTVPYSFKNHLSLTNLTGLFSDHVLKAPISGNIDLPEGGLDALMQVLVCQDEMNWRQEAHRLLVLSTDAEYHLAGDGKLLGIVEPNDGRCYLDSNGEYAEGSRYDYPSLAQINSKAIEHNINIIFAITESKLKYYEPVTKIIKYSSAGVIDSSSSNIAKLIYDKFEKISETIHLMDNASGPVHIEYKPLFHTGVKRGTSITFQVTITVDKCDIEEYRTIQIKPSGLSEHVWIRLETMCECPCEKRTHSEYVENSTACSSTGDLACGVCQCHKGYIGRQCHCKSTWDPFTEEEIQDVASCKPDNTTDVVCSGNGECLCGVCRCNKRNNIEEEITGQFCECDNYSCPKHNGQLCSGTEHGTCKCKKCHCLPGWTGENCQCPSGNASCIAPSDQNGDICSRRGVCECGQCICSQTDFDATRYYGKYCQICTNCRSQKCGELSDCVQCLSYGTHNLVNCSTCSDIFNLTLVDDIQALYESNPTWDICDNVDPVGCTYMYLYKYEDDDLKILSQRTKACTPGANYLFVIVGVTGSTVLIGVITILVWKLLTYYHDKREFEKFEKERNLAKFGKNENPIFKKAVSSFQNPVFKLEQD